MFNFTNEKIQAYAVIIKLFWNVLEHRLMHKRILLIILLNFLFEDQTWWKGVMNKSNFIDTSKDTSINHEDSPHYDKIKLKFATVLKTLRIHFHSFIFAYIFSSLRLFFTLLMDHRNLPKTFIGLCQTLTW